MKKAFKRNDIMIYLILFLLITILFLFAGHFTVSKFMNYYYNLKKEEALKLARSYSYSLNQAALAFNNINKLLEDKLHAAGKVIILYRGTYSNKSLKELAETLNINKIYYYNKKGKILYSSDGDYIGWIIKKGHPVEQFMKSNQEVLVEDIRKDTESNLFYKYGYFRNPDGTFFQLGINAEKITKLQSDFKIQNVINEIWEEEKVDQIIFIDDNFNIIASTKPEWKGINVNNSVIRSEINKDKEFGYKNQIDSKKVYEVFVPVKTGEKRTGTIGVRYSLEDTEGIINFVRLIFLLSLILIYGALFFIMISQHRKNKKLVQLAFYDSLTGLPNERKLKEFLTGELKANGYKKAVLLVNFNNFKIINMAYGFEYGDQILKELGKRIKRISDNNKTVFRFTADRFVLYVKNYQQQDLINLAQKICDMFNQSWQIRESTPYLSGQIGIVEINDKYDCADSLLKDASIIINNIDTTDTCNYAFFNQKMEEQLQREDKIEYELRKAIDEQDLSKLYLNYQPLVSLKSNKIIGFEALARMRSESSGFVSPLEFINIAERKNFIIPLSNFILKQACGFLTMMNSIGYIDIMISVNVSGIQLLHENFTDTVKDIIQGANINASSLELEITESILLENFGIINNKLEELQNHQIKIALDDFGTGYSSLYRLRELNVDTLKIDRYFINNITSYEPKELLTRDIISMGHRFGLEVVAEGVELPEERDYLIANNCDIMQGYLFSKPLSEEDALKIIDDFSKPIYKNIYPFLSQ